MSCKIKYTPAEFIAIMAIGFVQGELLPSIDKDGSPIYVMQMVSEKVVGSGCAATLIVQATANAKFLEAISKLGTHESCDIGGISRSGIQMWDLVEFQYDPLRHCYGGHSGPFDTNCSYCNRTRERVIRFFQSLQGCHDDAAIWFHTATTSAKVSHETAITGFRRIMLSMLKKVAGEHDIPWSMVEVGIVSLGEPLRERVPAIGELSAVG